MARSRLQLPAYCGSRHRSGRCYQQSVCSQFSSLPCPLTARRCFPALRRFFQFAVREGLIQESLRTALVRRIDGLMEELAVPFGENRFLGRHTRRIFNLLARDPLFEAVPVCPATRSMTWPGGR